LANSAEPGWNEELHTLVNAYNASSDRAHALGAKTGPSDDEVQVEIDKAMAVTAAPKPCRAQLEKNRDIILKKCERLLARIPTMQTKELVNERAELEGFMIKYKELTTRACARFKIDMTPHDTAVQEKINAVDDAIAARQDGLPTGNSHVEPVRRKLEEFTRRANQLGNSSDFKSALDEIEKGQIDIFKEIEKLTPDEAEKLGTVIDQAEAAYTRAIKVQKAMQHLSEETQKSINARNAAIRELNEAKTIDDIVTINNRLETSNEFNSARVDATKRNKALADELSKMETSARNAYKTAYDAAIKRVVNKEVAVFTDTFIVGIETTLSKGGKDLKDAYEAYANAKGKLSDLANRQLIRAMNRIENEYRRASGKKAPEGKMQMDERPNWITVRDANIAAFKEEMEKFDAKTPQELYDYVVEINRKHEGGVLDQEGRDRVVGELAEFIAKAHDVARTMQKNIQQEFKNIAEAAIKADTHELVKELTARFKANVANNLAMIHYINENEGGENAVLGYTRVTQPLREAAEKMIALRDRVNVLIQNYAIIVEQAHKAKDAKRVRQLAKVKDDYNPEYVKLTGLKGTSQDVLVALAKAEGDASDAIEEAMSQYVAVGVVVDPPIREWIIRVQTGAVLREEDILAMLAYAKGSELSSFVDDLEALQKWNNQATLIWAFGLGVSKPVSNFKLLALYAIAGDMTRAYKRAQSVQEITSILSDKYTNVFNDLSVGAQREGGEGIESTVNVVRHNEFVARTENNDRLTKAGNVRNVGAPANMDVPDIDG
jgi:hypothetical protein